MRLAASSVRHGERKRSEAPTWCPPTVPFVLFDPINRSIVLGFRLALSEEGFSPEPVKVKEAK